MAVRIKDLTTTATEAASDDYVAIDGATNGTRKILASDVGGGKTYDYTSSLTPSMDARGVSAYYANVYPSDTSAVTATNANKIKAYILNAGVVYPLIVTQSNLYTAYFYCIFKSISASVQNTSSTTISGTLHIVSPFEISNVTLSM